MLSTYLIDILDWFLDTSGKKFDIEVILLKTYLALLIKL